MTTAENPGPEAEAQTVPDPLAGVPPDILVDLVGAAAERPDPARRDYGERYSFLRVIGEGGQGVVVAARDRLLEREVAIKALKRNAEPVREEILRNEARIGGLLEHPNILPTYDLCEDETGSPFLVMKKVEGVSLETLLKESRKTRERSLRAETSERSRLRLLSLFLQVCHAIDYAHSRGVLHLDLKPQNIKIGPFGEVLVLDWGFAAKREDPEQTFLAGTPMYIAPERFTTRKPDERCDIYSLGVILYRLLTGDYPRDTGDVSFETYRNTFRSFRLIAPRERDPGIPPELAAITMKAVADDPDDRYESVAALAEDLERFLDLLPVSAYAEGVLGRSWKFLRRHNRAALLVFVLLAAGLVAGGLALRSRQYARRIDAQDRAIRLRAQARIPLEKATDLVEKRREKVEEAGGIDERRDILAPALRLFEKAITIDPAYADAYYERGKARYLARDMRAALADFRTTYELDPSFIMAHYQAGVILSDVYRDHPAARAEFEAMKEMDPANEYSELGQARIDLAMGRFDRALERAERIERLNPEIADIWYIRGMVHGNRREKQYYDPDRALAAYDRFLEARRDSPSAFGNRGDLRKDLGDTEGAIADYSAALQVNPKYKWARLNRGYLLYKELGRVEEALADMEAVLRENPREFHAYMNRAAIYEYLRRFDEAEADYTWAEELEPENPVIHYRKGVFYLTQLRFPEAEAAFTRGLELTYGEPGGLRLYHRRGLARFAMEAYAQAAEDFRASLAHRRSGRIYPALMLALTEFRRDDPGAAEAILTDALTSDGHEADPPWLLAVATAIHGGAAPEAALTLARSPEARCEVQYYLGAWRRTMGDVPAARAHFRAAIATGVHLYMEHALARNALDLLPDTGGDPVAPPEETTPPEGEDDDA